MWKSCVFLVMLCAWQACHAQELVNLAWPHISQWAPHWEVFGGIVTGTYYWKLFDHDTSTFQTVRKRGMKPGVRPEVSLYQIPSTTIRPTHYRIIMAAHVPTADYPSSWKVRGSRKNRYGRVIKLDQVTGAVFENGVYEGTLRKQIDMSGFILKFSQKKVTVAEVELLGPRSALDVLWPYGKYPCSQRHAVITRKSGPKKIFSRSKNFVARQYLRGIFNARLRRNLDMNFDGVNPIIIGAKLPSFPMVHEVWLQGSGLADDTSMVVLQGNLCEDDHCSNFGGKGWVNLVERKLRNPNEDHVIWSANPRDVIFHVENPGEYKAYRFKFFPSTDDSRSSNIDVHSIHFLGCMA